MEHTKSEVLVYCTTEYGRFKMLLGNRQLDDAKIKRITRDINDGIDVLKYYPIQVYEKKDRLEIDDGQHRFYIAKKLKRPVYYILLQEERSLTDIAKINSNTEKWKTKDFINCYVQQGNSHYQLLQDFMDKYGWSSTVAIKMLMFGTPGTESGLIRTHNAFQRGQFQVVFMDKAVELAERCKLFEPFLYHRDRNFIIAVYRILHSEKVTMEDLLARYKKNPEKLQKQAGFKEYIFQLEQIYNIGKQNRVIIY